MSTSDKVAERLFRKLDLHLRKSSIAQVGGFRPPEGGISSWFGGQFVGVDGEAWPVGEGGLMVPLIQVRTDELPFRPKALEGIALLTVFIGPKKLPLSRPAKNGDGWVIRTYPSIESLRPLTHGGLVSRVRPFPIRWSLAEAEGPHWYAAWELAEPEMREFNELPNAVEVLHQRYKASFSTKVGGWPTYAQEPTNEGGFAIQISSEQKANWMWGNDGCGHLHRTDAGEWALYWDCY